MPKLRTRRPRPVDDNMSIGGACDMAECPTTHVGGAVTVRPSDELLFRARSLSHGLFNTTTLRRRRFDGFIASMQQSGSHWLKYMLGLTLAKIHDLPPPNHLEDNSIVGHPKWPPVYSHFPQIVTTHSMPHYLLLSPFIFRLTSFPRYLVVIRDIHDGLVAHYEKHKGDFDVDFSTFLRGDVRGRKYLYDIWVRIRFLNGWGAVVERHPDRVAVLKYEDLRADTVGQLARVCDHFHIEGVTPDLLDDVVAAASKDEMARRPNPKWVGAKSKVVRTDPRPTDDWYSDADRRFVAEVCRRNLKYTFGYTYR